MSGSLIAVIAGALVGAGSARLLRVPMWAFTGSLIGAGAVHLASPERVELPTGWLFVAQTAIGVSVGSRLGRDVAADFRSVIVPGIIVVATLVPCGIALGLLLARASELDAVEGAFGVIPGGVGEMVSAVAALGGDSAAVAAMHIVRLLLVVWVAQIALGWLRRRKTLAGQNRP